MKLGRIEKASVKELWWPGTTELADWLAQKKNLENFGDQIDISLKAIKKYARKGASFADILAEDTGSGKKVLIACNLLQDQPSDFNEIAKRASKLKASCVIWIIARISGSSRPNITRLNRRTGGKVKCLIVTLEVWKINRSLCAPKFTLIPA